MKRIYKHKKGLLRRLTLLAMTIAILVPLTYFLVQPKNAEAAWYDTNWAYRQAITVTVSSNASDITSLETLVTGINTSALISTKLQSSCQDLRFTSATGKLLPYYIDSGCNTSSTKIWLMLDLVPKNTTTYTVYMYYGNPGAVAGSDANKFRLFNGLVGYWPMNESSWVGTIGEVKDYSVSANNGRGSTDTGTSSGSNSSTTLNDTAKTWTVNSFAGLTITITGGTDVGDIKTISSNTSNQITISGTWAVTPNATSTYLVGTLATTATGQYSRAGSFDGQANFMFGSDAALPSGSTNRTVSLWYNLSSSLGAGKTAILFIYGTGTGTIYSLALNNTAGTYSVGISTSGTNLFKVISTPSTSTWYNLIITHTSAGVATFYLNGVQLNSGSITLNTTLGGTFVVGRSLIAANYFNGLVDDLRVYNRLLSQTEITQLYNNPGNIASNAFLNTNPTVAFASEELAPGPLLYWKFDEGTGTTTKDSSSSNNTGTLGGSPLPTWQTEDQCVTGKCLYFDGANSKVTGSKVVKAIKTIGFWVKPDTIVSQGLLNLDGGTHVISTNSSGVVVATGFTSPTIYINGVVPTTATLTQYQWNHVEVTTGTSFDSSSSFTVGTDGTNFIKGFIDEVKFDDYVRTLSQVQSDFNSRSSLIGGGTVLGASAQNNINALNQGLVGYWKMDESSGNAADSSGNGNSGTNTGTVTYTAGKFGNAGTFDGSSQYFTTGTSAVQSGQAMTLSVWVNQSTSSSGVQRILVHNISSAGEYGFYTNTTSVFFRISAGNGNKDISVATTRGVWEHYVGVVDGLGNSQLYKNGLLVGTATNTGTTGSAGTISIGRNPAGTEYFKGSEDEIRIYKRALSPADVNNLYNFGPGPLAYYNFEEKTGTSANDLSGNANTGTWAGTTPYYGLGKYGSGGSFNGTDDKVSVTNVLSGVQTVSFWVYPTSTTNYFVDLDSGTHYITASAGTVSATGFSSPTIYVNGQLTSTIVANSWQYITVTTATGFASTNPLTIGKANGSNFLAGRIDEVRFYNYVITRRQLEIDMGGGSSAITSGRSAGPLGYWKFDDGYGSTAINSGSLGTSTNGTLANNAGSNPTWTQNGKFGKALTFNGATSYVNTNGNFSFSATDSFSASAWVKSTITAGTVIYSVIDKGYGFSNTWGLLYRTNGSGKAQVAFGLHDGTIAPSAVNVTGIDISDGRWHYIVGVRDVASDSMITYTDGLLQKSITDTTTSNFTRANNVFIGARGNSLAQFFNGSIDEPKIYPYALTPQDILEDYNRGAAELFGASSDNSSYDKQAANQQYCVPGDSTSCAAPIAEYNFEEKTGTSAQDTSGNANTGTWAGTTPYYTTGKYGEAGNFNGTDDKVSVTTTLTGVKSVGFWVYPTSTTNYFIDFDGGTHYITASSGTVSATGFTSPTIYINGIVSSTIVANSWQHVEVTTGTSFNSTNPLTIGKANGSNFMVGKIDQVRIFDYTRSAAQVAYDYNLGAPVGWWKFDGCQGSVAIDSSGNNNPGTINLSTTGSQTTAIGMGTCANSAVTPWFNGATGKINASLNFDGTNDYVDAGTASYLAPGTGDYSVSLWAKPSSLTCSSHCGLISSAASDVASGHQGFELFEGSAGGGLRVEYSDGTTQIDSGNQVVINNGVWNHIVLILSPTLNHTYIYLNGVLKYTRSTYGVAGSVTNNHFLIGLQDLTDTTTSWAGQLDDVRAFNYPLTSAQVKNLYNNGAVNFGPGAGSP